MMRLTALVPLILLFLSPAQAARVVSLNLCTDEFLLLLAPEQAIAVTPLARDPSLSVVAEAASHVPVVRADAEAVLDLHPDLVLAAPYGAQATLALLARRGLRIIRINLPEDFPAIRIETRRIADVLGVPARGEALLAEMDARLAALPKRTPTPALFLEPRGWTAGAHSLAAAVMRAAGLQDTGSGRRVDLETLAAHPPALLVTETPPGTPSLATDMLWHPALRGIPRRTIPPALLTCGGPWTAKAAEILPR
jgi:iron complex transport system substrate-binding protein